MQLEQAFVEVLFGVRVSATKSFESIFTRKEPFCATTGSENVLIYLIVV